MTTKTRMCLAIMALVLFCTPTLSFADCLGEAEVSDSHLQVFIMRQGGIVQQIGVFKRPSKKSPRIILEGAGTGFSKKFNTCAEAEAFVATVHEVFANYFRIAHKTMQEAQHRKGYHSPTLKTEIEKFKEL